MKPIIGIPWTLGDMHCTFSVGDEASDYTLTLGSYDPVNSTVNDSLSGVLNGRKFRKCSSAGSKGGWWYKSCSDSSLTGFYYNTKEVTGDADGISWEGWYGSRISLNTVVMAIRPIT